MPAPSSSGPTKAYLVLIEPPEKQRKIPSLSEITGKTGGGNLGRIDFQFNPASYSVSKGANWGERKVTRGLPAPRAQFTGSNPATMSLDLLLDHSMEDRPTITRLVDLLLSTVVPIPATVAKNRPTAPWVIFGWGNRIPMVAVVTSVSATYTLFRSDGTPVRASCKVDMSEVPTKPSPKQNPTSGATHVLRQHVVVAGDSLPWIAQQAYGSPARWRDVADANGIDDPTAIREGQVLLLPNAATLPALEEDWI